MKYVDVIFQPQLLDKVKSDIKSSEEILVRKSGERLYVNTDNEIYVFSIPNLDYTKFDFSGLVSECAVQTMIGDSRPHYHWYNIRFDSDFINEVNMKFMDTNMSDQELMDQYDRYSDMEHFCELLSGARLNFNGDFRHYTYQYKNNNAGRFYAKIQNMANTEKRAELISAWHGGALLEADYITAEPRAVQCLLSDTIPEAVDIYEVMAKGLDVDRKIGKQVLLKCLYTKKDTVIEGLEDASKWLIDKGFVADDGYMTLDRTIFMLGKTLDLLYNAEKYGTIKSELTDSVKKKGYILDGLGRAVIPKEVENTFNTYMQATVATFCSRRGTELNEVLNKGKSRLIMFKHDAFVIDLHPSELNKEKISEIRRCLESEERGIQLNCKMKVGYDYYNMEELNGGL